ncbi:hypothetical protein M0805_002070 [Coniferiporia weirii]|nr:hypothetical protein M0805_002070 [Coniferiporia weirii]
MPTAKDGEASINDFTWYHDANDQDPIEHQSLAVQSVKAGPSTHKKTPKVKPGNEDSEDSDGSEDGLEDTVDPEGQLKDLQDLSEKDFSREDQHCNDILTIFVPGQMMMLNTGKVEEGHFCSLCHKKHKAKPSAAFFTSTSVSTLRTHISRMGGDHYSTYIDLCTQEGIPLHEHCKPKDSYLDTQMTLDNHIVIQPKQKPWSHEGLLAYMVQWVVCNDQSAHVVDKHMFRDILKFQRPLTMDQDVFHHQTVLDSIYARYEDYKVNLHKEFVENSIAYWIDNDFVPHEQLIAFHEIVGSHTSANMGEILLEIFGEYGICDTAKLGWGVADNATVCDQALKHVGLHIDPGVVTWRAKERCGRCMEHMVKVKLAKKYNASKNAAKLTDSQTTGHKVTTGDSGNSGNGDESNVVDDSGSTAEEFAANDTDKEDQDLDKTEVFNPDDLLGKVFTFIAQVCASPQARKYFKSMCEQEDIKLLQLLKWVRTRWASLYDLLVQILEVCVACDRFCLLADSSDKVLKLCGSKSYAMFRLTNTEWELLELIRDVLKEPSTACQSFSHASHPSLYRSIPVLEFLQEKWETMAVHPCFAPVRKLDEIDIYFITLVLDPSIKMQYFETHWDGKDVAIGKKLLEKSVWYSLHCL